MRPIAFLWLALSVITGASAQGASGGFPDVYFEYGASFDDNCPTLTDKVRITGHMQQELSGLIPQIQETWSRDADALLGSTTKMFNRDFRREELSVALVLCPSASLSYPLLVSMRQFVTGALPEHLTAPRPLFYLQSLVFHEILHRYINESFPAEVFRTSAYLKKYAAQGPIVLHHIHLYAIQKAVYLELHREDELAKIIEWNSQISDPGYRQAWEIVDREGYHNLVADLKRFSPGAGPTF